MFVNLNFKLFQNLKTKYVIRKYFAPYFPNFEKTNAKTLPLHECVLQKPWFRITWESR